MVWFFFRFDWRKKNKEYDFHVWCALLTWNVIQPEIRCQNTYVTHQFTFWNYGQLPSYEQIQHIWTQAIHYSAINRLAFIWQTHILVIDEEKNGKICTEIFWPLRWKVCDKIENGLVEFIKYGRSQWLNHLQQSFSYFFFWNNGNHKSVLVNASKVFRFMNISCSTWIDHMLIAHPLIKFSKRTFCQIYYPMWNEFLTHPF